MSEPKHTDATNWEPAPEVTAYGPRQFYDYLITAMSDPSKATKMLDQVIDMYLTQNRDGWQIDTELTGRLMLCKARLEELRHNHD